MIFRDTWEQVIDHTKTQTRRIVQSGEQRIIFNYDDSGLVNFAVKRHDASGSASRLKWIEGREYAVQPTRGHKAVGRFLLKEIHQQRLQDITEDDIIAEGISAPRDMFLFGEWEKLWNGLHGKGEQWDDNPPVWVLRIECVDPYGWTTDTKSIHYFKRVSQPIFWAKGVDGKETFLHYISRCGRSFMTELIERVEISSKRGCKECRKLIDHDRCELRQNIMSFSTRARVE